jgi:hypothetical protein
MSDHEMKNTALEPQVSCEICCKEIPRSSATTSEGEDYVLYFCGLHCYDQWRDAKLSAHNKTDT